MTDIRSWLGSGDPPLLDSLLDLPDTLNCTENHTIENMDLSWFDDKTFIGESLLFDGYNSSNPIGPDEPATQIQPEPFSSNILQETDFPGLENLPEVVVGESHDSLLQKAGPHVLADPDVDQTTTNEQNKRRPGSPTLQPSKRNRPIFSQSSKRRTKLSPDAKKVLEEFFAHNIYPEPNDVAKLVEQTGAEEQQIKTWFRNQRSRKLNFGMSGGSEDISQLPRGPSEQNFATELAGIPHIDPKSLMERYLGVPLDQDDRIPTIATPIVEPRGDQTAAGSDSSWSSCGSQNSWSSRRGRRKVNRYRKTGLYDPISDPSKFRCTFCGEGLKDRYQWRRHEETKHAPRTGWICKDAACADKRIEDSIFFREDLFTQHCTKHRKHGSPLAHGHSRHPSTKFEIVSANPIPEAHPALQCGFCGERLPDWADRVNHIAAHFEKGANLSSWWLKRAEFVTDPKNPPSQWPHDDFKEALSQSVFCIFCERLYLSLDDAKAQHLECTTWSCGHFEGIQAAYEKSTSSRYPLWSCIYCDETILEVAPDHSSRLSHLIIEHAYRSCTPQRFSALSDFQDHLRSYHKTSLGRPATLESACRLARKPQFRSAMDASSIYRTRHNLDSSLINSSSFKHINILGRSLDGDLRFVSALASFDLMSPDNIISLKTLRILQSRIDLQIENGDDGTFVDTSVNHVGDVVIEWGRYWGDQGGNEFLRLVPGMHVTRFSVRDYGSGMILVFGRPAMTEINMIPKSPLRAQSP